MQRRCRLTASVVLLWQLSCVLAQFSFPLPAGVEKCMTQLQSSLDEIRQPGLVAIVQDTGAALNVQCLHEAVPETGNRPAALRFTLTDDHFNCEEGPGTVCNGSIGSVLIQSAFSRETPRRDYSARQFALQQWLGGRCAAAYAASAAAPEHLAQCLAEFRRLRYRLPALAPPAADAWRAAMAQWLCLDDDPFAALAQAAAAAAAADAQQQQQQQHAGGDDALSGADAAFWRYVDAHPAEAEADFAGIVARFYAPDEARAVLARMLGESVVAGEGVVGIREESAAS